MRNVWFVLVSVCFGFSSGFVIHSDMTEFEKQNNNILSQRDLNSEEMSLAGFENITGFLEKSIGTIKPNKLKMNLENLQNDIKEKVLYEGTNEKGSNVDERSFVFIDQKFKVPVMNHLHNLQQQIQKKYDGNGYRTFFSNYDHINTLIPFDDFPSRLNAAYGEPVKGYVEGSKDTRKSYFPPAPMHQFHSMANSNRHVTKGKSDLKVKLKVHNNQLHYPHREMKPKVNEINSIELNEAFDKTSHNYHDILEKLNDLKMKVQTANGIVSNQYRKIAMNHKLHDMKQNINDIKNVAPVLPPPITEINDLNMKGQVDNDIVQPQYAMEPNVNFNEMQYNFNDLRQVIPSLSTSNYKIADEHREYLELLKPPLLRPESGNSKTKIQSNNLDDTHSEEKKMEFKHKDIDISKNYNNYGFLQPFTLHENDFNDKKLDSKFENERMYKLHSGFNEKSTNPKYDKSLEEHFRNDDFIDRAVDSSENKILNKFLKNTFSRRLTGKHKHSTSDNTHCKHDQHMGKDKRDSKCKCSKFIKKLSNNGKGDPNYNKERDLDIYLQDNNTL